MTTTAPPVTGTWTAADDLTPTATWDGQHDGPVRLTDGTILIVGGADAGSAPLARAARFEPATGGWTPAGALHTPRRRHTVTALGDGGALVAGGTSAATQFPPPALATSERLDPGHTTWSPTTGPLRHARWGHSAVALGDGSVLVAGGSTIRSATSLTALRSVERFDPGSGQWTDVAPMNDARTGHVAVVLGDGKVLVIGGTVPLGPDDEAALAFCELYDPAHDTWTATGSLTVPRARHQAVLLSPTTVLVVGGQPPGPDDDAGFDPFPRATAEVFNQTTGAWTAVAPLPGGRELHRAVALDDGQALVAGGTDNVRDGAGFTAPLVFDGTGWTAVPGLAVGRWGFGAAALQDGSVLVVGGVTRSGQATAAGAGRELTATTELFTLGGTD
ncbi:Kelch repeat-containing protein [Dactylosporangium sp. McL0621]|uniref:Kelch repeat-containing protein n=1 Tax=Dactylosporangium sp. McL0621 TaxID=3415678 RepID=UPI003CF39DDE